MNLDDFKRLLGADPWNREPETLRARHSGPEFEQAAAEVEAFERKLQAALEVPDDPALSERILAVSAQAASRRGPPGWLALAASVVLVAGSLGIVWLQSRQPSDLGQYLLEHYAHDGASLVDRAGAVADPAELARILADFGVEASPPLAGRVRLIKYCPTPDGRGAHMVLASPEGPVHLIYMPATGVSDGQDIRFDGMHAQLLALTTGSAAMIAPDSQPLGELERLVRSSIVPLQTDT
jgi:hypothetical protein